MMIEVVQIAGEIPAGATTSSTSIGAEAASAQDSAPGGACVAANDGESDT